MAVIRFQLDRCCGHHLQKNNSLSNYIPSVMQARDRLKLVKLISLVFNYMYYLGSCPFRLHLSKKGYYEIKTWMPQKVR